MGWRVTADLLGLGSRQASVHPALIDVVVWRIEAPSEVGAGPDNAHPPAQQLPQHRIAEGQASPESLRRQRSPSISSRPLQGTAAAAAQRGQCAAAEAVVRSHLPPSHPFGARRRPPSTAHQTVDLAQKALCSGVRPGGPARLGLAGCSLGCFAQPFP